MSGPPHLPRNRFSSVLRSPAFLRYQTLMSVGKKPPGGYSSTLVVYEMYLVPIVLLGCCRRHLSRGTTDIDSIVRTSRIDIRILPLHFREETCVAGKTKL